MLVDGRNVYWEYLLLKYPTAKVKVYETPFDWTIIDENTGKLLETLGPEARRAIVKRRLAAPGFGAPNMGQFGAPPVM